MLNFEVRTHIVDFHIKNPLLNMPSFRGGHMVMFLGFKLCMIE